MSSFNLSRAIAVTSLVLGPASLIGVTIAQWLLQSSTGGAAPVDVAATRPGLWSAIAAVSVLGPLVWLAGIPAVIDLPDGRGSRLSLIGGLLTGAGLAAGIGHLALFFGTFSTLAAAHLGADDLAQVVRAADGDELGNALLLAFLVGYSVGRLLLAVGLRMARLVPVWVPLAAVLTAGANLLGGPLAGIVQLVALVALWAPVVRAVARVRAEVAGPALARSAA